MTLSPLGTVEARGITFSLVNSSGDEMGVVTWPQDIAIARTAARSAVERTQKSPTIGMVPRTQAACDLLSAVTA